MEEFELLDRGSDYFVAEVEGETYLVEDMGEVKEGLYEMRVGDSDTVYTDDKVDSTSERVRVLEGELETDSYDEVAEYVVSKHLGESSGLEFDLEPNEEKESESQEEKKELTADNGFGLDQY